MSRSASRVQTRGEEIASSISHGAGIVAVIVGAPFLIMASVHHHSAWTVVGSSVFLLSMLVLYSASTIYHAHTDPRIKQIFRVLDHGAIYILIAGTYTPFTLGALRGGWGWALFGVVWGLAAVGITLKARRALWHPILSAVFYLAMGWLIVIAINPFWHRVRHGGLLWLLAGGIAYTGGIIFYGSKRKYAHLIWHLCVIAGTACHFFAVLWYAG
jgi:hemolysin III